MPYASNDELPPSVRDHLPDHAKDIFVAAFNSAFAEYGGDEETAFRIAWTAVKRSYVKEGGEWVPKGVPG